MLRFSTIGLACSPPPSRIIGHAPGWYDLLSVSGRYLAFKMKLATVIESVDDKGADDLWVSLLLSTA
jgi:hypothetical protein